MILRLSTTLLLCMMLLCATVYAVDAELSAGIDPEQGLPSEIHTLVGDYDGAVDGFGARLLRLLQSSLGSWESLGLGEGLRTVSLILAASLLCGLLEHSEQGKGLAPLVGSLSIAAACTGSLGAMIRLGTETIENLHRYVELLLPGMTPLLAAAGGASAAISGLGMVLFDLLLSLVSGVLVPMLYFYLLLCVAESAFGADNLSGLQELINWLLVSSVKLVMWGFSAVLGATGLVTGSIDAQKLRTLRAAIAGMVPVVGNVVSEASGSLISAAGLLKTGVGLYGMLAVFGICLGPFFRIGLQYLLLKLSAALCGLFGKGNRTGLLEKLCHTMGLVLALTGVACTLSLMILVLCIRTVSP